MLAHSIFGASYDAYACPDCGCHSKKTKAVASVREATSPFASPVAAPQGGLRFAIVGDTQGLQFLQRLTTDMNAHRPDFALYPGDLVDTGTPAAWEQWKSLSSHFIGGPTNRFMVPGNHDVSPGRPATFGQWQSAFAWLPSANSPAGYEGIDYYFDRGNSRFISLTNNTQTQLGGVPPNLPWLQGVLADAAATSKEHVFVMSHHPVTFDVWEPGAPTGGTAGAWWQSLAAGNVTALFAGHWHQYQPGQPDPLHPTWEVILGTGNTGFSGHPWQNKIGYSIVDVLGPEVTLRFYGDRDGDGAYDDLLDTAVLATAQPAPSGVVAAYGFEHSTANLDTALSPHAKANHGVFFGNAVVANDPVRGSVLRLDGAGDYSDGRGIGDYNLAILRDLTIVASANFDSISTAGATLVSYTANVAGYSDRDEIVNQPYNLSLRRDLRMRMFWEHDNGVREEFVSTAPAPVLAGEWHDYRVTRDATNGEVRFYVDGVQVGAALTFDPATDLPTGGQQGTLRIGVDYDRDAPAKLVRFFAGKIDNVVVFNSATLASATPPLPGDLTLDGRIDAADSAAFAAAWGMVDPGATPEERWRKGDLNLDGVSDLLDLAMFQRALATRSTPSTEVTVPEPLPIAAVAPCVGAAIAILRRRRSALQGAAD
ncbi:MAG: metallophosphoesterase [Lacipirellulaceae bacterium]